ncbi:hypothetical protein SAMN05421721_10967 [Ectothiorhodospira mobilis]|uniref:Uncharacterized protein n=1 Tax=Ectothiorhodospira mobilis TaxID=195064 RepID=A0A1I4RSZ8_ECTMO|nr:hypothetical protein [Ectothiorhodospira mobilis]SFM55140.1 hypothetical protein SAMN05421721_10967 [Ectothiorhodospira mobilis]
MSDMSWAIIAGTLFALVLIFLMKKVGGWADRKYHEMKLKRRH